MPKGRIGLFTTPCAFQSSNAFSVVETLVVDDANHHWPVASCRPGKCFRAGVFDQHENQIGVLRHLVGDRPSRPHVAADAAQLPDQRITVIVTRMQNEKSAPCADHRALF